METSTGHAHDKCKARATTTLRCALMASAIIVLSVLTASCQGNSQADFERFVLRPAVQVPRTVNSGGKSSVAVLEDLLNRVRQEQLQRANRRATTQPSPATTTEPQQPTRRPSATLSSSEGGDPGAGRMRGPPSVVGFCVRQTEVTRLGFGLSTSLSHPYVSVDVGKCVRLRIRPMLLEGNSSVFSAVKKCRRCQSCEAIATEQQTYFTRQGPNTVDVVKRCGCLPEEVPKVPKSSWKQCRRNAATKTFYKGTRFETTVDVGQCAGSCRNGTCQVAERKCHVVKGPNGKECVDVVKTCTCSGSCRLTPYKKAYREFVYDSDAGRGRYQTRIVDVGKCSGPCPKLSRSDYCTKIRKQLHFLCKLSMSSAVQLKCVPASVRPVAIRTSPTQSISVMAVQSCSCKEL